MKRSKAIISKAKSYKEIAEFWSIHDLADYWNETWPVKFAVDIQSEVTYYPIDISLSNRIRTVSKHHGVSPDTLINLWLQEKLLKEKH